MPRRSFARSTALLVAAWAHLIAPAPAGATLHAQRPGDGGVDPRRLARIDSTFTALVAQRRIPGVVTLVIRDGRVVHHKAFGTRDMATGAPLRTDDIFRIASQTKAITTVAAMMLWEEGRFRLDDPVSRYLPDFEKMTVLDRFEPRDSSFTTRPARRRMTIRQLMTHSSGLDYADIGSEEMRAIYAKAGITALGREGDVLAERMRALARLPLRVEPGTRWQYSLSIELLGRLVEVSSGMPLDRFVRERICVPLGMADSYFELPADRRSRLVAMHRDTNGVLFATHDAIERTHPDYPARPMTYFSGGGGMSGTIGDYARFLRIMMNGGELDGVRLLSRKTVELMLVDHVPTLGYPFGLGFALETTGNDHETVLTPGSFSWGGAFGTVYWADPKERLIALAYSNAWGTDVMLEPLFRALVYAALR